MSKSLKLFSSFFCPLFLIILLIGGILPTGAEQRVTSTPYLAIFPQKIDIDANDFAYDETTNTIYVSVPDSAISYRNSIVPISVPTGTVGTPILVGSNPNRVELADDGSYLYVGLDGSGEVKRVNLELEEVDIQFYLGRGSCSDHLAEDLVVLKDHPESVAVSIRNSRCTSKHEGVAIFDNGIKRPNMVQGFRRVHEIEPSDTITKLYGYNNKSSLMGFYHLGIDEQGIFEESVTYDLLIYYFRMNIKYHEGKIYASNGVVIDPSNNSVVGRYDIYSVGAFSPNEATNQMFFAYGDGFYQHPHTLEIFELDSFTSIDTIPFKLFDYYSGSPIKLEYLGENYLVLLTNENKLYILQIVEFDNFVYLPMVAAEDSD